MVKFSEGNKQGSAIEGVVSGCFRWNGQKRLWNWPCDWHKKDEEETGMSRVGEINSLGRIINKWIGTMVRKGLMNSRNAQCSLSEVRERKNNTSQSWNFRHELTLQEFIPVIESSDFSMCFK